MKKLLNQVWYTIEDLVEHTGYQKGTLYNLTVAGIISPPILGLAGADYSSQGLYKESVLAELARYNELKTLGMRKRDIIEQMKTERVGNESQLQILETGRQGDLEAM